MREYKFRCWMGDRMSAPFTFGEPMASSDVWKSPIMQFTGLHDKNGKEIFEGDILQCKEMHDSNIDFWARCEATKEYLYTSVGVPYQVKWWNHGWDVPCDPEYWEVLGNIYEHPELLKGATK